MIKTVILIGDGRHSYVIRDVLGVRNYLIYDDKKKKEGRTINDLEKHLELLSDDIDSIDCVITIGNNNARCEIYNKIMKFKNSDKLNFINVISRDCKISNNILEMGIGNHFLNGCIIETHTLIGNFNIFNTNSSVNHDCEIGNFCHISPHASLCGNCKIGDKIIIPTGYNIIPNWCITSNKK